MNLNTKTSSPGSAVGREFRYARPWLYQAQREAIFCPERYAICEATVKSGKTIGCIVWLAEQAMQSQIPGRHFWWIAPIRDQARIAFDRLKRGLPRELYTVNESRLELILANGSIVVFKGADQPDSLFGSDVFAAVIDEATRCKVEAWHAVRSTLTATRGPIRIIGNVKGRKNWAYRLARRAEAGEPDMHYSKITAHDAVGAGVLDASEIEDARRALPDAVFRELYLAEPSDDEGNPFGAQFIRRCVAPLSTQTPFVWGVDLAKSHDYAVAVALDRDGRVCRFERWQASWDDTMSRLQALIGVTPALVDSTGVGDPIVEKLQKTCPSMEGFKFTLQSKQMAMEGLAVAIQQQDIHFPDDSCPTTRGLIVSELEDFEYVYTRSGVHYSAPEGATDDCVCALALAQQMRLQQGRETHPFGYLARDPAFIREVLGEEEAARFRSW